MFRYSKLMSLNLFLYVITELKSHAAKLLEVFREITTHSITLNDESINDNQLQKHVLSKFTKIYKEGTLQKY